MTIVHKELASGRWFTFPLTVQLANVGSEVERALRWREKGDSETSWRSFERALELLDLTLSDERWRGRRKEITRIREAVAEFFVGNNTYQETPESLRAYFLSFAHASRRDPKS